MDTQIHTGSARGLLTTLNFHTSFLSPLFHAFCSSKPDITCTWVRMYVCMHAYIYYVRQQIICVRVFIHVCMHACMHVGFC